MTKYIYIAVLLVGFLTSCTSQKYNDFVAKQLQQKIAKKYELLKNQNELDKFLEELSRKYGITLYF